MSYILEQGGLINMLLGRTPDKRANKALDGLLPTVQNEDLLGQVNALRKTEPNQALGLLLANTSPEARAKTALLGKQTSNAETQGRINEIELGRLESNWVSPADQSLIDYRNAQVAGMNSGPSQHELTMRELELQEQQLKTEGQRQINHGREVEAINAANEATSQGLSGAFEADSALANISTLLDDDAYKRIYGFADDFIPTVWPEAVTLEAKRDQVVSLLGLESRQKLKGQGTITDNESQQLAASATILGTAGISEGAAKSELNRVRDIFERAKERSLQNPETFERYYDQTGISEIYRKVQSEELSPTDLSAEQRIELGKYIRGLRDGVK